MEMLNMKRYELPQPPAGKLNDLTAWKESVRRLYSLLCILMWCVNSEVSTIYDEQCLPFSDKESLTIVMT